jgi:hypothetical protein
MRNDSLYGTNDLIDRFMSALREFGPANTLKEVVPKSTASADALINWSVAGQTFPLFVDAKVFPVEPTFQSRAPEAASDIRVVVSPFVSRVAQDQLARRGLSYWDPTGNVLLQNADPFLWIQTQGASKNPQPEKKTTALQSLKGRSASEVIVRLLANGRVGTARDLAREAGVGVGTASRVVSLLREENFFETTGGGPLVVTDPIRLARRWAEDYSFERTYRAKRYFSVLGTQQALDQIKRSGTNYALTGLAGLSLDYQGQSRVAPLPASDLWLYTDDLARIEREADLVPDAANGTIVVAEADFFAPGRENYRPVGNTSAAWPWRIAGDLLSASGRYAQAGLDLANNLVTRPMSPYA